MWAATRATITGVVSRGRPIGLPQPAVAVAAGVAHQLIDDSEGMAASSSQVAKVCRRSWGPRRSKWASSAGRLHGGLVDPPQVGRRWQRRTPRGDAVAASEPGRTRSPARGTPASWLAIGNRWSQAGTSGQCRRTRIAGQTASTAATSAAEPPWGRVQVPLRTPSISAHVVDTDPAAEDAIQPAGARRG